MNNLFDRIKAANPLFGADCVVEPFPDTFPHKGQYRTWDAHWNPSGYADSPQYTGAMPIKYPVDATPFECFIGGYLRAGKDDR